jgi:hypothetical protein
MSGNRSVQAAKRRAESTAPKPISTNGKQQKTQAQPQSQSQSLSSVNKMTITQAITLITLRLSSVESKLINMGVGVDSNTGEGNFDSELLKSILERLDYLENQTTPEPTNDSATQMKLTLLEQKIDVIAKKGGGVGTQSKTQMDELKTEIKQMKELLQVVQGVALDNSQKIMELTLSLPLSGECDDGDGDGDCEGEKDI